MISPVSSATPVQNVIQTAPVKEASAPSTTQSAPITDTVQISNAAKSAFQEANETAAQTTQEANKGDHQAQRLQARHAAEKAILDGKG